MVPRLSGFEVRTVQSHWQNLHLEGYAGCVLSFKNILVLDLQLRKITKKHVRVPRSIGTVCCFNLATVLQATLTGLLVSSHFQIRCQCDFTYSSFKVTWEDERPH